MQAQLTRTRAMFLAEASERLAGSLELDVTLRCMADLSVPELGTACLVCLLGEARSFSRLVAKHRDPRREELLVTLGRAAFARGDTWQMLMSVAASGQPAVLSLPSRPGPPTETSAPLALLGDLGLKSALLVPVMLRGRRLATVVFLSARSHHYGPAHIRLADELTSRFAFALEAAQAYRSREGAARDTGETLATTIHDLMSPLTYIKGTAQRLRRVEPRITDLSIRTELRSRLEAIDSAANRMASTLTALLRTTSPQTASCPKAQDGVSDLVMLARRAVAEQQLLFRQHSIVVRDAPAVLEGEWDADRIERMLWNLIGNAVKYSPPGSSVELSLAREPDAEGCWAVVHVNDQGMGIPAGDLPFVFEPFRRGSNVGQVNGTGLGLASVWQTVNAHHGRVWVDSEQGKGTRVTVRLPLALTGITPATSSVR